MSDRSRREFPLKALLELRERIKKERRQALAAAIANLDRRRMERERAEEAVAAARTEHRQRRQEGCRVSALPIAELTRTQRFIDRLAQTLAQLEARAADARLAEELADEAIAKQREALAAAQRDLQVVEKSRGRFDQARRKAELERAELELDDLVAARRSD